MIHEILYRAFSIKKNQFIKESKDLKSSQEKRLAIIFKNLKKTERYGSLHDPAQLLSFPVQTYSEYEPLIERQIQTGRPVLCPDLARIELTSGSTRNKKQILYSKAFLQEINEASTVWMADLYSRYPGIKSGPHYWTLSWSPGQDTDDSELFPWIQRLFLQKVLLLNQNIRSTPTLESSWFATLVKLVACRNLSLISIWSPTLLSRIKRDIQNNSDSLISTLKNQTWTEYASELNRKIQVPYFDGQIGLEDLKNFNIQKIWPCLSLISAWDSASSRFFYDELKGQFPKLNFQGKGLWATEGVVTLPIENKKVLAFKSHYYEFKCIETNKILQSWQLQKDQIVEPILTSSNGLVRYLLEDRIQVSDYYNSVPCFEFLGRSGTSDLVGEKLTDFDFLEIQNLMIQKFPIKNIFFFSVCSDQPYYFGLYDSTEPVMADKQMMENYLEESLLAHFNYQVARNLKQLKVATIWRTRDLTAGLDIVSRSYSAQGQFKVQPLYRINVETLNQITTTFEDSFPKIHR